MFACMYFLTRASRALLPVLFAMCSRCSCLARSASLSLRWSASSRTKRCRMCATRASWDSALTFLARDTRRPSSRPRNTACGLTPLASSATASWRCDIFLAVCADLFASTKIDSWSKADSVAVLRLSSRRTSCRCAAASSASHISRLARTVARPSERRRCATARDAIAAATTASSVPRAMSSSTSRRISALCLAPANPATPLLSMAIERAAWCDNSRCAPSPSAATSARISPVDATSFSASVRWRRATSTRGFRSASLAWCMSICALYSPASRVRLRRRGRVFISSSGTWPIAAAAAEGSRGPPRPSTCRETSSRALDRCSSSYCAASTRSVSAPSAALARSYCATAATTTRSFDTSVCLRRVVSAGDGAAGCCGVRKSPLMVCASSLGIGDCASDRKASISAPAAAITAANSSASRRSSSSCSASRCSSCSAAAAADLATDAPSYVSDSTSRVCGASLSSASSTSCSPSSSSAPSHFRSTRLCSFEPFAPAGFTSSASAVTEVG
mmetsp:Transcript_9453/g.23328  ORF Transcript_9453/g.23328 Transcript_9453/m.23328 type:complete len:505 (+) Transcript_9453:3747-5261(+)